ncbi:MAG TPA: hypothetical protein PLG43_13830, partial [Spirochaetia bacterium]|nr:hypothetical protein [Spirochaetia bacterium]
MKALKGLSTIFLMFLLTCCHTFGLSEDTKEDKEYVVNTGHKGKIFAVRTDASRNIIVSGGEDGTIQVWDGLTLKPKTILRLSNLSIRKIALHPELPQVAVIESDNISIFTLSVWDYERKKKLFSIALNELPLFLEYSPAGSFILYSRADWKSL